MIQIEKLAYNISEKIALQMEYDEDKKAVIAYGLMAMFQMAAIFILISCIGILLDFWFESIIIYLSVGIIRKSTGGTHASSMNSCIIISVLSITLQSAISRYLLGEPINIFINIIISIIIFAICFIVFYFRVPVDTPNKPIVKPEKIKRLRKQSFLLLIICFILTILFAILTNFDKRFFSIAVSIRMAMIWQVFTLTKTGAFVINTIDSFVTKVINISKERS